MRFLRLFTAHPASVGESYWQHLASATGFGTRMIGAGLACLLHGLFPWLFRTTGSDAVRALHARMIVHRHRAPASPAAASSPMPQVPAARAEGP